MHPACAVVDPVAAPFAVDEPSFEQHAQVVTDRGLRQVERIGQVADARLMAWLGLNQAQDRRSRAGSPRTLSIAARRIAAASSRGAPENNGVQSRMGNRTCRAPADEWAATRPCGHHIDTHRCDLGTWPSALTSINMPFGDGACP